MSVVCLYQRRRQFLGRKSCVLFCSIFEPARRKPFANTWCGPPKLKWKKQEKSRKK